MTAQLAESSTSSGRLLATPAEELAAVLADVLGIDRVPADSHFFDDLGADSMVMARFCARLRKRPDLPSVSIKDVYQHPTVTSLAAAFPGDPAVGTPGPVPAQLAGLSAVLADVLHVDSVPVDSHFFDDLGADSMVMAQFCARVRKRDDLPTVSIKDVYRHPTMARLAAATAPTPAAVPAIAAVPAVPAGVPAPASAEPPPPASTLEYVLCGALQLLVYLGYSFLITLIGVLSYRWITEGAGVVDMYLRTTLYAGTAFVALCTLPIAVKWLLIGRWKPQQIRIWSWAYVRFWFVKTLVNANPLRLFVGSPLYVSYLRLLGAKIGRGVAIFSTRMPVCTDLLTIGEGSVIRKDSFFSCYRAEAGVIETGPVTLGKDVHVSEWTVLDIGTSMGDGAQLGHASSLHAGQSVPAGGHWHGSPAVSTDANYRMASPTPPPGRLRTVSYAASQLLSMVFVYLPLVVGGANVVLGMPQFEKVLLTLDLDLHGWVFYADAAIVSAVLFFGGIVFGLLVTIAVPRLLSVLIEPGKAYRLYGLHYWAHRTILRTSNSTFLTALFGDSSYIVPYLRWIGYKLEPVVQTGSNFGTEVKHENPFLVSVGTGTVCASELSIMNADYSSTSFRVTRAAIGAHNFLGNLIAYPAGGRTGDNCLLATKVLVPIDGEVRQGVGLLGSPAFEIPRMVERDSKFARLATEEEIARRLPAKNRHNLVSMGWLLLARWGLVLGVTLIGFIAADLYAAHGVLAVGGTALVIMLFGVSYGALIERAATGFKPLQPKYCSIYDIQFWREERFYKLEAQMPPLFDGTPFKSVIWRLLGVRVGRRLFDDGANMAEKNLVSLGDHVTLNSGVWLQCHSQEDYAFKSDHITIGNGCTIGVGAMTLYGITMNDGSVLGPDSFLMKGEEIPAGVRWGGNPAQELSELPVAPAPLPVCAISDDAARPAIPARDLSPLTRGWGGAGRQQPAAISAMAVPEGGAR